MTDIKIMLVPPGSISDEDAAKMEAVGVLCIECVDASKARLMVGESILTDNEMLWSAAEAILSTQIDSPRIHFGKAIAQALLRKKPTTET